MPRSLSNLGRNTKNARRHRLLIKNETEEQREFRLSKERDRISLRRSRETSVEREHRLRHARERKRSDRVSSKVRTLKAKKGNSDTNENLRLQCNNEPVKLEDMYDDSNIQIKNEPIDSDSNDDSLFDEPHDSDIKDNSIEFTYEPIHSLSVDPENCSAMIYKDESNGECCLPAKVKIEEILPPPKPQHSLQILSCESIGECCIPGKVKIEEILPPSEPLH